MFNGLLLLAALAVLFGLISDLKDKISLISKLPQKEFKDLAELKKVLGNLHVDNTVKVKAETTQNDINGNF